MKVWIYLSVSLAMWITATCILAITNTQYTASRVDRVHTYQRTKAVSNYAGNTRNTILSYFTNINSAYGTPLWDDQNGPGCVGLNYFYQSLPVNTTNASLLNPTCFAKRTMLVSSIKQQMACDVNKAPVCNCLTAVLRAVAQDNSANSTQGNFTGVGKNLAGLGGYLSYQLDECKWLYRNVHTAVESSSQMVRRTGVIFYMTTLTFFNLLDHTLIPWLIYKWNPWLGSMLRIVCFLLTAGVGLIANLVIEPSAFIVITLITVIPVALLTWYELLLPPLPTAKRPWLHPYYFATSLGCLTVLAMIENGVQDYDAIAQEITKVQALSFLYMMVVWFYVFDRTDEAHTSGYKDIFDSQPVQLSVLIATGLAVSMSMNSMLAPYNWSPALNYIWILPQVFVLYAFGGITWVYSLKLSEFYGGNEVTLKRKAELESEANILSYFPTTKGYFCSIHLGIQLLVLFYYISNYDMVSLNIITQFQYNPVALNTTATWLLPS